MLHYIIPTFISTIILVFIIMSSPPSKESKAGSAKYKLLYFNGRWVAEPSRIILSYAGVTFEDVRIQQEDWPPIKKDFKYGTVPELHDLETGEKFYQSFSIARYLAKKYDLAGQNIAEATVCDEYADAIKDLLKDVEPMWTADDAQKAEIIKKVLTESGPKLFPVLTADLKANGGTYLVGNGLTWADIMVAHFTELFEGFVDKSLLDNYPSIKSHQQRVFNIPKIKEYISKRPASDF